MMRVTSLSVAPVDFGGNPSFIRVIEVDRRRSPYVAFKAAAPENHIDMMMATTAPLGITAPVVEMTFFQLGSDQYGPDGLLLTNLAAVMAEYDRLDLEPDPLAQAALNEANKEFSNEFPNMSVWYLPYGTKDNRAYLRFDRYGEFQGRRNRVFLECDRGNVVVDQSFWFGGVQKSLRPFTMPSRG